MRTLRSNEEREIRSLISGLSQLLDRFFVPQALSAKEHNFCEKISSLWKYARGRSFAAIRFDDLDTGFNCVPRWLVGCKYIVLSEFSSYKKGYVFEILIIKLLLSVADSRV